MHSGEEFAGFKGPEDLAKRMVETKKDKVYPLGCFVTLAPILPITTATVERIFSCTNILKNRLCNRMGDK